MSLNRFLKPAEQGHPESPPRGPRPRMRREVAVLALLAIFGTGVALGVGTMILVAKSRTQGTPIAGIPPAAAVPTPAETAPPAPSAAESERGRKVIDEPWGERRPPAPAPAPAQVNALPGSAPAPGPASRPLAAPVKADAPATPLVSPQPSTATPPATPPPVVPKAAPALAPAPAVSALQPVPDPLEADDAKARAIGEDPANILGPEACSKCHAPAYKVWQGTHHFAADKTAPRSELGKQILTKLGGPALFKKRKDCTQCHVTMQGAGDKAEPKWGISCESCHGAAAKWISIHNNKAMDRSARLIEAAKNGMCRPDRTYKVLTNCMECHTVPNEEVINKGGHAPGHDFDALVFSQGEVRHNFLGSPDNAAPTAGRKRELYLIGQVLFLEYGLRGLAKATVDGDFAKAQSGRVERTLDNLEKIQAKAPLVGVGAILQATQAATAAGDLRPGNKAALLKVADAVHAEVVKLSDGQEVAKLSALDEMLPGERGYIGKVQTGK
ncbi:MAG: hypothetical protein HYZ53_12525 [Planctomycetes bacterium]|nr:hypothetical protein [Planctomycetota bacterium]